MYPSRTYRIRRGTKILIGVSAAALVFTAIGLIIMQIVSPTGGGNSLLPPPVPNLFGSSPASPAPTATESALTGPVQVIQGSQLVNGVYLGFPHSTQGAVSAADEYWTELGSTLDPDRAAAVMRLIADPSYTAGPQQAAQGPVNDRESLGLPTTGPVLDGASLVLDPVEYQVRDVTPDQVSVLLLGDFISTLPSQGTQTRVGVFPMRMHWAEGDWKVLAWDNSSYTSLAAEPGSPQAAENGWQSLEPAGG
jgi:hypothetical protein